MLSINQFDGSTGTKHNASWLFVCVIVVLLTIATVFIWVTRANRFSEYTMMEQSSREYILNLYSMDNSTLNSRTILWPDFAMTHGGVKSVNLVTKVCKSESSNHICFLAYQTAFKDQAHTMTYGVRATRDENDELNIELLNATGGRLLLSMPDPFVNDSTTEMVQ
ncbi:hypothetical protein L8R84_05550 [Vibrio splendidus]|uniref:hypothetical protein n=1 Tax=Vibrio splendidus TaxID=29497 RepID=UPI002468E3FC|nr:hypothetical protein [Vibrio splendidus]MDH5935605.1 hypothetical protein [Vibrio splendidus]